MDKNTAKKREKVNLFFSAFLIIGYVICAFFLNNLMTDFTESFARLAVNICTFTIFGLLLFYATRVGEGKQVKRFNVFSLIFIVIPALYIVLATMISGLPLHNDLLTLDGNMGTIAVLSCVALGYGIPYTFLAGFELKEESEKEETQEDNKKYKTIDLGEDDEIDQKETSFENTENESSFSSFEETDN